MRILIGLGGLVMAATVAGCETTDRYAMSACERDYIENRNRATAAGAAIGAVAGAAIDDDERARGAAIGAAVGGLIGRQLSREDDPCGYGFGGYGGRYAYDDRPYGYDPSYGYYDERGRWVRR